MPRKAREKSETGIYHVVLRGSNKQLIFEEEEDSKRFLEIIFKYQDENCYSIYAYCLMGNHIHILLKEEAEELGIAMRRVGASFVYWYNNKYDRYGHLFQDRYHSEPIKNERQLLATMRYIHNNPVKAGIVLLPEQYKWSSYQEYISVKNRIKADTIILLLGEASVKEKFKEFHQLIDEEEYLDINESIRITDEEAVLIVKRICKVLHCNEIQHFDKKTRDTAIKNLLNEGISTRQLSRITGISRNIIMKT